MRVMSFFIWHLIMLPQVGACQVKDSSAFILNGKIQQRDTGLVVLWYPATNGKYLKDTAIIQGGFFRFRGQISEPSFCWLFGSKPDETTTLFLEPGEQNIVLAGNRLTVLYMDGSFTQQQYDTLGKRQRQVE